MITAPNRQEDAVAWHALSPTDAAAQLGVIPQVGLSGSEAEARLTRNGPNALPEQGGRRLWSLIGDQFRDIVIWILLAATGISAVLGEYVDAVVIVAIVLLNAALGVLQEWKAENALAALKRLATPCAHVLRDGIPREVAASEVVPGDVLLVEAGHRIAADARLLEAVNLRVDESSLTGESETVEKDGTRVFPAELPVADRLNLVHMGTAVTHGRGRAVVIATGVKTELGRIAIMVGGVEPEKTPLQARLEEMGRWLAMAVLAICGAVFAVGALRGLPLLELFMTSVSLAVAAIPEGLPAIVTIVLALGMQNMVRRHTIVRKLRAVEALGSTTVICTDKTGTLTENAMTARRFFTGGRTGSITGEGYEPEGQFRWDSAEQGSDDLHMLLEIASLCNDAHMVCREGTHRVIGDPTEGALLVAAAKAGITLEKLEATMPRLAEVPFDANRKQMSTLHTRPGGIRVCVKGAPDLLLSRCMRWQHNGQIEELSTAAREAILHVNAALAEEALRVLGVAYRDLESMPDSVDSESVERDLIFVGLLGMIDPPRPEARLAVAQCRAAGIRPVMVTGDNPATGLAIARELKMAPNGALAVTGAQLQNLSEESLRERIRGVSVFARVSPADKLRIVGAYQAEGAIVAMTGDGVNDAPALKQSDIGVAMGRSGTDVAREAADIVLTDDNFASVVAAVEEGRGIFNNIRKFVLYLLSCNLSEVLTIFLCILAGLPRPLLPVQILWVNLVTDGLPALALGVDPKEPGLMEHPPRDPKTPVLDRPALRSIFWHGGTITLVTLLAFLYGLYGYNLQPAGIETWRVAVAALFDPHFWEAADLRGARTMAFTTLALSQLSHALNSRSETRSLFELGLFTNRPLIVAIFTSALAQLAVVYIPLLQPAFGTVPIAAREFAVLAFLALTPLLLGEARKSWLRHAAMGQRTRRIV